ncbi:MAG: diaminopimelate decarboxylase [Clostridium perfringens]|nr:diaminopimelate decarboxylase [Clostridium perfringens]
MKIFGAMKIENNELNIGGVKASDLVKEYGTPLYVMDEELIRDNCKRYYNGFNCSFEKNRVTYAGKAFLNMYMCNILKDEGLYLDVVSGGELYTAYKANFPLEHVYFHGNNKTENEIELGVKLGVGRFVVDNFYELNLLNKIAKSYDRIQKVYLRITPGIEAHTHEYIKTGQLDSKFGFPLIGDSIIHVVNDVLKLDNIELTGIHCHIGSQIFDLEPFKDDAKIMVNLANDIYKKTGYLIKEIDFGGGFGIYYTEEDKPKEIEEYCKAVLDTAEETCKELGFPRPIFSIEPGRSLIGNAGTTLYKIGAIKEIENIRKYACVDGGMTDNIRPALYNAKYECVVANRVNSETYEDVTIAGKCCESGDILIDNVKLNEVKTGDILAVLSTGAYGYSMASNYNRIPRAAVVMVSNGDVKIACKRESYEDIIRNDLK